MRRFLPILLVQTAIILLLYPLALLFGLPLARRDMQDLRKWEKETIVAAPVNNAEATNELSFARTPQNGILIKDGQVLNWEYQQNGDTVSLTQAPATPLVSWSQRLEPAGQPNIYSFGKSIAKLDYNRAVYVGNKLMLEGATPAKERSDGERRNFSFGKATGPVLVANRVLSEGRDYQLDGRGVVLSQAPAFGSSVRRLNADYAVLDANAGTIIFAELPRGEVRAAASALRFAELLSGPTDGQNRLFAFEHTNLVQSDNNRQVFVDNNALSDKAERPQERVDGQRQVFTFEGSKGIVTVDDKALSAEQDYRRDGPSVTFIRVPARNAKLRQYPDFFVADPAQGKILLAQAPTPGSSVWSSRYTVYSQPSCGSTALECFYALPQQPVPFPHWIVARILPFFQKFPLGDERNVIRATLYTTFGTLAALALGGAIGIVLAVLFVLLRPLERALLPWVIASQTVPIIALVPVLLLVLGNFGITIQTSLLPTAIIGAYIAFFPVVVGTVKGLRSVDPLALDLMKSYAATPLQVFIKLRFPAAAPFFFTSLKLGTAAALVGALVAETESNNRRGLGFQILGQVQSGNVADVWILLIISGLLGIGLVALIGSLERLSAPWGRR